MRKVVTPLLGPQQRWPFYCAECGKLLGGNEDTVMQPVLCEGEVVGMGRYPDHISAPMVASQRIGRVLFARWTHKACARDEPSEEWMALLRAATVRRERLSDRDARKTARVVAR